MEQLRRKAADILRVKESRFRTFTVVRQSIDARKKPDIFFSYVVDVELDQEESILKRIKGNQVSLVKKTSYHFPVSEKEKTMTRPVIVGMGPAGLFCGYFLARHGYRPILLERGAAVEERMEDVEAFWKDGVLKPDSNVQFGEGGAGTFSDGKLNTLVKDRDGRNKAVLETFVKFGAKKEILYDAKPHIGTDVLCEVVRSMREEILRLGGEVRFHSKVTKIHIRDGSVRGVTVKTGDSQAQKAVKSILEEFLPCEQVVLAIGHSARDTFAMLYDEKIPMEAKSFAVGLRVEHPQTMINTAQYGSAFPKGLGAAPYKVAAQTSTGRGVYSFCMCPGGYVVNASSEEGRLAVNGMSYSGRDGRNANSAVIVAVTPEDYGSEHPLAGIEFQRRLEEEAYRLGQGRIPVQRYGVFRRCVDSGLLEEALLPAEREVTVQDGLEPQNKGSFVYADVSRILPEECNRAFVEGMKQFARQIPGFDREDAILSGVESRTSSPVRIPRGPDMQSAVKGLYPCGEGAGYAGGITSAAMDGIKAAEAIALRSGGSFFSL